MMETLFLALVTAWGTLEWGQPNVTSGLCCDQVPIFSPCPWPCRAIGGSHPQSERTFSPGCQFFCRAGKLSQMPGLCRNLQIYRHLTVYPRLWISWHLHFYQHLRFWHNQMIFWYFFLCCPKQIRLPVSGRFFGSPFLLMPCQPFFHWWDFWGAVEQNPGHHHPQYSL